MRRQAVETLDRRRDVILTGLYGAGIGGEELREAVKEIDKQFDDYKRSMYTDIEDISIDHDDPFFAAMKVPDVDTGSVSGKILYGFENIEIEPG
jgi:hypothetical protein